MSETDSAYDDRVKTYVWGMLALIACEMIFSVIMILYLPSLFKSGQTANALNMGLLFRDREVCLP